MPERGECQGESERATPDSGGAIIADHPYRGRVKVYQPAKGFRYSVDAFILLGFAARYISDEKPESVEAADLGSGSGIVTLGLALQKAVRRVTGIEIVSEIAEMSRRSAIESGLAEKVKIISCDYKNLAAQELKNESFDLVVSNPPYRPVGEGKISPDFARAAARHEVAANLNDLIRAASTLLKSGGIFCLIFIPERLTELLTKLRDENLEPKTIRFVHPKPGADARMALVKSVKNSARGSEIMTPLFIHDDRGRYTREMEIAFEGPE